MNAYTNPPEKEFPGCPHSTVLWGQALVAQWRPAQIPEASSHERRHHLDASTPWGPRSFSVQKPQVCDFYGHKQMQMKFQPFYSKQLLTMYKYCILAHMKNTTSKAPRMCSYTLQDHSQRECTICSRQSAFDKSEDYYPSVLHPVSGNIYNVVRKGQLYLLL